MGTADLQIVADTIVLLTAIVAAWDLFRRDKIRLGAGKATPEAPAQPQEAAGKPADVPQIGRAS